MSEYTNRKIFEKETLLPVDDDDIRTYSDSPSQQWSTVLVLLSILFIIGATIVVSAFLFSRPAQCTFPEANQDKFHKAFLEGVSNESLSDIMRYYSSIPHIAGSWQDKKQAEYTHNLFLSYGFESEIEEFNVMLTYPIYRSVQLLEPIKFNCSLKEPVFPIDNTSGNKEAIDTWNAWSADGDVTGELVYVNYGTKEDYDDIKHINLTNKIVIVRYGNIFRANKVRFAEERGALGVLIFTDSNVEYSPSNQYYPDGAWGPNQTAQRGMVWMGNGDPTTPGWPSISINNQEPPRISLKEAEDNDNLFDHVPRIPVQPISFDDAVPLLSHLGVNNIPKPSWAGPAGITQLGPGPSRVRLVVKVNNTLTPIWNVIGTIKGAIEPDKIVVLGCHRDAWTMGAADPISGTAVLLESARGYSELLKKGWLPRRTIKIMSWDAEEYGLIGSFEHSETWRNSLSQNAVIYVNVDVAVTGKDYLGVFGSPSLKSILKNITDSIELAPGIPLTTRWDQKVNMLGDGSDYASFFQVLGVPSLDVDIKNFHNTDSYPSVYHSNYDSYYWVSHYGDPLFFNHSIMTKFYGMIGLKFADSAVLPFDYINYGLVILNGIKGLANMTSQVDFSKITFSASTFYEVAHSVEKLRQSKTEKSVADIFFIRALNERLCSIERTLLSPGLLSNHEYYGHVLFTPSASDSYGSAVLPAILNQIQLKNYSQAQYITDRISQLIYLSAKYLNNTY